MQNVKLGKQKIDWIGGINHKIIPLNNGDWSNYRPIHETQNNPETWGCTIFSGLDCIETLFMYYLSNHLIPNEYVKWLTKNKYFINGFINFSEAYNYQFAKIEKGKGTYLFTANNAIRRGLVPEQLYSFKDYFIDKKPITDKIENLRKEFNKRFIINWYWVENINEAIKCSPLQATVKFANGNEILKPEGRHNHAIMVYKKNGYYSIDDSYSQRTKKYNKNYVSHFIGYTLTINNTSMNIKEFLEKNDLKWIFNNNTGEIGRIIQGKLRTVKTNDRGVKILLDNEVRKNGKHITNEEWLNLPKKDF